MLKLNNRTPDLVLLSGNYRTELFYYTNWFQHTNGLCLMGGKNTFQYRC